jgi:hypothetical protein
MGEVVWRRINNEPFEYAIQQGRHGDEFVKLLDGSCLRRPAKMHTSFERLIIYGVFSGFVVMVIVASIAIFVR